MTARSVFGGLLAVSLLQAGCAGYRLGNAAHLGYQTIAVPLLRNRTTQPQLEAQVTNALIKRLQQDGTLRVQVRESADVILQGEIIRYQRTPLRYQRDDSGVPREYRVALTVRVEAHDQRTGELVLPVTTVTGQADTFIGSDLQSADGQALPLVADDIARQVVSLLVETWQ